MEVAKIVEASVLDDDPRLTSSTTAETLVIAISGSGRLPFGRSREVSKAKSAAGVSIGAEMGASLLISCVVMLTIWYIIVDVLDVLDCKDRRLGDRSGFGRS